MSYTITFWYRFVSVKVHCVRNNFTQKRLLQIFKKKSLFTIRGVICSCSVLIVVLNGLEEYIREGTINLCKQDKVVMLSISL